MLEHILVLIGHVRVFKRIYNVLGHSTNSVTVLSLMLTFSSYNIITRLSKPISQPSSLYLGYCSSLSNSNHQATLGFSQFSSIHRATNFAPPPTL